MFFSKSGHLGFTLRTWHFFGGSENTAPPPPPGGPYRKFHSLAFCKIKNFENPSATNFFENFFFPKLAFFFAKFFDRFLTIFWFLKPRKDWFVQFLMVGGSCAWVCTVCTLCTRAVQNSQKSMCGLGWIWGTRVHTLPQTAGPPLHKAVL